jgi:hypothetical protein
MNFQYNFPIDEKLKSFVEKFTPYNQIFIYLSLYLATGLSTAPISTVYLVNLISPNVFLLGHPFLILSFKGPGQHGEDRIEGDEHHLHSIRRWTQRLVPGI